MTAHHPGFQGEHKRDARALSRPPSMPVVTSAHARAPFADTSDDGCRAPRARRWSGRFGRELARALERRWSRVLRGGLPAAASSSHSAIQGRSPGRFQRLPQNPSGQMARDVSGARGRFSHAPMARAHAPGEPSMGSVPSPNMRCGRIRAARMSPVSKRFGRSSTEGSRRMIPTAGSSTRGRRVQGASVVLARAGSAGRSSECYAHEPRTREDEGLPWHLTERTEETKLACSGGGR
jgi:hypothetical protein